MKRYPAYKESGVEWIGEIPAPWFVILFKRVITALKDGTHGTYERVENGKPLLSAKNLFFDGIRINEEESLISEKDFDEITKNGFPQKNDLLLTIVGTIGRAFVYDKDCRLAFQRSVLFIRLSDNAKPKYFYYLAQSTLFFNQLISFAKTSAQSGVYMRDVSNLIVPLPQKEDQIVISEYLDYKTHLIDTLIEKKLKQIELLQEQRAAIINQAVTKGLNPNVKMKDSEIEWLGEVPEHWVVEPLKHAVSINRSTLPEDTYPDYELHYIDIGNVSFDGIMASPKVMSFSDAPSRARRIIKFGDTIISTVRTYLKAIAFIDFEDANLIASTGFAVLSPNGKISPRYLYHLIANQKFIDTVSAFSEGVSYPAITASTLGNIQIWYPIEIEEQNEILNFLERRLSQIKTQKDKTARQIDLLREYRSTLISEVVTGKIDVRDEVIP